MKKIAFPTNDGETLSPHLGQAQYFLVASLEENDAFIMERREKPVHQHGSHEKKAPSERAGEMLVLIQDCQVLISRGLGQPAYGRAIASGKEVWLVAEKNILAALEAYRAGTLVSDMRRIHKEAE